MTAEATLTRLREGTVQAVCGVLEGFCPGAVQPGEAAVLGPGGDPLAGFPAPCVAASVSYTGGPTGGHVFVMTLAGAHRLAAAMTGAEPAEGEQDLDEFELPAVSEAMGRALAAAAGATGELLGVQAGTSPPRILVLRAGETAGDLCAPAPHATGTGLTVLGEPARLVQLVPDAFLARGGPAPDDLGVEVTVRGDRSSAAGPELSGITMRLTAEIGRARMRAGRAVALPGGAVVELDADVDAPIQLLVNGVPFASGRLLVTEDGDWAVRVEDVAPRAR